MVGTGLPAKNESHSSTLYPSGGFVVVTFGLADVFALKNLHLPLTKTAARVTAASDLAD
jgi:hypothetical protein